MLIFCSKNKVQFDVILFGFGRLGHNRAIKTFPAHFFENRNILFDLIFVWQLTTYMYCEGYNFRNLTLKHLRMGHWSHLEMIFTPPSSQTYYPFSMGKFFWHSTETFLAFSWFQYQNFLKTFLAEVFELWCFAWKGNLKGCIYAWKNDNY